MQPSQPPLLPSRARASSSPMTSILGNVYIWETFPVVTRASVAGFMDTSGWDAPSRPVHSSESPTVLIPSLSSSTSMAV